MQARMKLTHVWQRRLLIGLCWLLALEFTVGFLTKFYPGPTFFGPPYSEKFVDWGYPAWFGFVVGGWELLAAVMLVLPRRRFLGAVVLVFILTGAVTTHIINHHSFTESVSAPVHLVLAGLVALACWPVDWREPLALGRREPGSVRSASRRS